MADFHHVADEYDRIGRDYQESKALPFRKYVEEYTTFGLLPNLVGRSVIDLACGEGIYARKLKRRGAERVIGVDISAEMIALARRAEAGEPLGVAYVVADVAAYRSAERYDVAFCSYLLNYARSRGELRSLIHRIADLVAPDGVVVGCNDYPENPPASYSSYRRYGFMKVGQSERREGSTITYRFFNPDGTTFEIDNYYLPSDAYRQEFADAGFASFEWVMPELAPEGRAQFPDHFWDAYLEHPPIVSFIARP